MKKQVWTAALAAACCVSAITVPAFPADHASAAVNTQSVTSADAKADQLIQTAKSLIGKATYSNTEYKDTYPYKFSCASFLMYVFEKNGVDLATYNEDFMIQQGTPVAKGQWKKGDLLFFKAKKTGTDPDHVVMYIGDNKVIQMADPKQNIVITDMASKPYYSENYVGARRVIPALLPSNKTFGDRIVSSAFELKSKATIGNVTNAAASRFTNTSFINQVFSENGSNLGASDLKSLMAKGTTVSRAQMQKGDLVFFNSSTGSKTPSLAAIYAGEHRLIVPSSGKVQSRVMLVDYYDNHFITAKRLGSQSASSPSGQAGKPVVKPSTESASSGASIASYASSLAGHAKFGYTYSEGSLTFTPAGFTYFVYKKHGIDLSTKLAAQQAKKGIAVSRTSLQEGDLLLFSSDDKGKNITRTGIYAGNNRFITLRETGVKSESMLSAWAKANFVSARRIK